MCVMRSLALAALPGQLHKCANLRSVLEKMPNQYEGVRDIVREGVCKG